MEATLTLPLEDSRTGAKSKKRKATEICAVCKESYSVIDNEIGDCVYHESTCWRPCTHGCTGKVVLILWLEPLIYHKWLVPNYTEGDEPRAVRDRPDLWGWMCCGERANVEGCKVSRHVSGGGGGLRRRKRHSLLAWKLAMFD